MSILSMSTWLRDYVSLVLLTNNKHEHESSRANEDKTELENRCTRNRLHCHEPKTSCTPKLKLDHPQPRDVVEPSCFQLVHVA
jgi:hypothetical protein